MIWYAAVLYVSTQCHMYQPVAIGTSIVNSVHSISINVFRVVAVTSIFPDFALVPITEHEVFAHAYSPSCHWECMNNFIVQIVESLHQRAREELDAAVKEQSDMRAQQLEQRQSRTSRVWLNFTVLYTSKGDVGIGSDVLF